jgi:hypothetical protein
LHPSLHLPASQRNVIDSSTSVVKGEPEDAFARAGSSSSKGRIHYYPLYGKFRAKKYVVQLFHCSQYIPSKTHLHPRVVHGPWPRSKSKRTLPVSFFHAQDKFEVFHGMKGNLTPRVKLQLVAKVLLQSCSVMELVSRETGTPCFL